MKLDEILSRHLLSKGEMVHYNLKDKHHKSLQKIKESFYIDPDFKKIYESKTKSKLLIFSAPGATGKSALAYYLSAEYNCLYWDASKITIGEKTIGGVLMDGIGDENYADYKKDLQNGKTILIIDALDEAEIISGRKNLGNLLGDILELKNGYDGVSFILLARTDTANYLYTNLIDTCIEVSYYEIDFFPVEKSKEFVRKKIASLTHKKDADNKLVSEYIDKQFDNIYRLLPESAVRSFIGYAPVLETISIAYDSEGNTVKLINSLQTISNGTLIIEKILKELLLREQQKVVKALQERWSKYIHDIDWNVVYDENEQLKSLIEYITLCENTTLVKDAYIANNFKQEYKEVIDNFLPQHPFIRDTFDNGDCKFDFAGTAFRDYAMAMLHSSSDYGEYIEFYLDEKQQEISTLYYDFCKQDEIVIDNPMHLSRLYKSFLSKSASDKHVYIDITQDDEDQNIYITFKYFDENNKEKIDFDTEISNNCNKLVFSRLKNTNIDVKTDVCLNGDGCSQIVDSDVFCRNLVIKSGELSIERTGNAIAYLQCLGEIDIPDAGKNISLFPDDNIKLKVFSKNINQIFKLRKFIADVNKDESVDRGNVGLALNNILKYFRQHKKDTPAKDKEHIDNRVVGHSRMKRELLSFLLEKNVLYVDTNEKHLYKLKTENAQYYGIQWNAIKDISDTLYEDFCKWREEKLKL